MFITFEGGEGSGKTTISQIVSDRLKQLDFEVVLTREPGGIKVAEEIRSLIMANELQYKTEVLLFAAARIEHLENKIKPALNENKIVICDRYIDSSIVYQGYARGESIDAVKEINYWATNNFKPDLTIFFDVKPEVALKRISSDEREVNRFDQEKALFHQKIYDGYRELAKSDDRIKAVDASKTIEEVTNTVIKLIKEEING